MQFEHLCQIFDQLRADGYEGFCYLHADGEVHLQITKMTSGKAKIQVDGRGHTVQEAFETALQNFPTNPLDGSSWRTPRLAAPVINDEIVF